MCLRLLIVRVGQSGPLCGVLPCSLPLLTEPGRHDAGCQQAAHPNVHPSTLSTLMMLASPAWPSHPILLLTCHAAERKFCQQSCRLTAKQQSCLHHSQLESSQPCCAIYYSSCNQPCMQAHTCTTQCRRQLALTSTSSASLPARGTIHQASTKPVNHHPLSTTNR
jgi:hypothetical protein